MPKTITLVMHRQPKSVEEESEGCRMCLKWSGNFISMDSTFEASSDSSSYWDAYNFCTNLNALPTDGLPQIICMDCSENLKFVYEVLRKAIHSNEMLKLICERKLLVKDFQELDEELELKHMVEEAIEENVDECYEENQLEEYIYVDESIKLSDEEPEYTEEIAYGSCDSSTFVDERDLGEDVVDDEKQLPEPSPQELESTDVVETEENVKDPLKPPLPPSLTKKKTKRDVEHSFMCEFCAKTFTSKQKLKMHTFVHTKEKNFACNLCPKRFNTIFKLREHLRGHANIRNHECSVCELRFLTKHTLKCHMRRHTGERPYQCKICGKSFTQSSILKTHIALHQGKTAQCPYCPQKFSRPSHLILHQRSHTGERPYRCTLCPNSYKQKSHLDRHLDTHYGVKFVCEICSKQYTKKGSLKNHMYSHSEDKPFKCTFCEKDFPSKDRFRRHMRHAHKTEVSLECPAGLDDNTMTSTVSN